MALEKIVLGRNFILAEAGLRPEVSWFMPEYWTGRGIGTPLLGGRGRVVTAGEEGQWILRHYWRGGLPSHVLRDQYLWMGCKHSRPVKEFKVSGILRDRGAAVPKPIAARVRRFGLWYQGDILIERIPRASTLAERAAELQDDLWFSVGQCIGEFHNCGGCHPDLNAYNVLLTEAGVYLIDLDRVRLVKPGSHIQYQNVLRLRRSLVPLIGREQQFGQRWDNLVHGWRSVRQ